MPLFNLNYLFTIIVIFFFKANFDFDYVIAKK